MTLTLIITKHRTVSDLTMNMCFLVVNSARQNHPLGLVLA